MYKPAFGRPFLQILLASASLLLSGAAFSEERPPVRTACIEDPSKPDPQYRVVIPPDWKSEYPFSVRFGVGSADAASDDDPLIDLDAITYRTAPLVQVHSAGNRTFSSPDLGTFASELVRAPFSRGDSDLFLVQAASPAGQAELRVFLEKGGYEIRESIPRFAYLVRTGRAGLATLQGRPEVFWIGLYHQAYRVSSKLDYVIAKDPSHELGLTVRFDPALYSTREEVEGEIALFGLKVLMVGEDAQGWIVRAAGRAIEARMLAALPGVLWVERFVDFQLHNDVARSSASVVTGRGALAGPVMDVEDVWARGIRGEGQIASAADTGLDTGNITTVDSMHWDFGRVGNASNPLRVIKGYGLGRAGNWNDDQTTGGGHGTHTSGSIVGNGVRSGSTPGTNTFTGSHAGTAPKAQFVFQSIMDSAGSLGGIPANLNTLFQGPYTDGARVHSNSWGAAVAGAYDTSSQQTDQFAWNNKDMVITFSAGNSGVDKVPVDGIIDTNSIGSPGTAKNCITVGAAESYRPSVVYEYPSGTCTNATTWGWFNSANYGTAPVSTDHMANNANGLAAFSSRGPTADGRHKPDLVAPGTFILSTRTSVNQAFEQWGTCGVAAGEKPYYLYQGGTSMSNPLTAGVATLVRQYYQDGWHANNSFVTNVAAVPAQGFNPSSALVKATLINGAWEMSPGQYGTGTTKEIPAGWDAGHNLPNNAEGYGRVDAEHSLFPGSGWGDVSGRVLEVHDVSAGLATGGTASYSFSVGSSANPLVVTLAWTDPWASTGAGTKLVNNLDLVVTAPDGTTKYTPNRVDDTAGTADSTNNVEQVKVTSPAPGTWTIQVKGTNVPGNGTAGTNLQPYALVVSGVSCTAPGVPGSVSAAATAPNQVTVSWAAGAPAGATYRVYRSSGACPGGSWTLLQGGLAGSPYVDGSVQGQNTYAYRVAAVNGAGTCESAASTCSSATATGTCSLPPTFAGLATAALAAAPSCGVNLSWSAATSQCAGTISYNVYRSTTPGFTPSVSNLVATGLSRTAYFDTTGLVAGTAVYYVVRARDSASLLEDSNAATLGVTPQFGTATFAETFEGTGFDNAGWSHQAVTGATDWAWSTARSQTPTHSWFSASLASASHRVLVTPPLALSATSTLSFWHTYAFEGTVTTCYDGGTLEISTDGGTSWSVVPDAAFTAGGFTGTVNSSFGNPLAGKRAWCAGTLGTMTQVTASLAAWAGTTAKIRWREGDDSSGAASGWYVDSVNVAGVAADPVAPSTITAPATVCAGSSGNAASVPDAGAGATYAWTIANGTITTGAATRTIAFTASSTGPVALGVSVTAGNCPSVGAASLGVTAAPATPVVTAASSVVAAASGLVATVPAHAGSTYAWSITNGTITSGNGTASIVYTAGSPGPLGLSVVETAGSGGCPSAPGTATVKVTASGTSLSFFVLTPCRAVDTRLAAGPVGAPALVAGQVRAFPLAGVCGLPSTARAVSVNVTVTQPEALGYLTVFSGVEVPVASTINFRSAQTKANNALFRLPLDGTGALSVLNGSAGTVHFILDVNGYFE